MVNTAVTAIKTSSVTQSQKQVRVTDPLTPHFYIVKPPGSMCCRPFSGGDLGVFLTPIENEIFSFV